MLVSASATVFAATPADADPKATITFVGDENTTRVVGGETYYLYTATVDMTGIGTLDCTASADDASMLYGTRLVQYEIGFVGDLKPGAGAGATSTLGTVKQAAASVANNGFVGIMAQYATVDVSVAYPATEAVSGKDPGAGIYVCKFYGQPGEKVTIDAPTSKLGYMTFVFDDSAWAVVDSGAGVTYADIEYDKAEYTLPTFEEPEPAADVVVNSGKKYDNGYAWNVTVNKDMEAFGVKFYSGEETLEKSVKNVEDLPKLDGGVGYNFNVGLKTAKTIDQADFTADDATASWKAE
jgi:hypothetical protein